MKLKPPSYSRRVALPVLALLLAVVLMAGTAQSGRAVPAAGPAAPQSPDAPAPLVQLQGRLLEPGTGQPKPDGAYQMIFTLWSVSTGGTRLWTETLPSVSVSGGLYNVYLGGVTPLGTVFDSGADRWLGIAVGADAEAIPRIQVGHVPYAMQADLAANALLLNGQPSTYYAAAAHTHSYVAEAGDTMTGNLTVPKVAYSTPRLHVTLVSSEAFFPVSNVDYANGGGQGGAWEPAGSTGVMAASIQLPDAATVTKFGVYFYDDSAKDLQVSLDYQGLMYGGYGVMATLTTVSASTAYRYLETTAITTPVVNNVNNGYLVWVYPPSGWDDTNLRIKGAIVYYTLPEAP